MPIDFPNSPTNGDTYSAGGKNWQYNGSAWVLQGVVPAIPNGSITETQIADSAITSAKIAAGAVVEADLATDAVTSAKIASNAVTAGKLGTDVQLGYRNVIINGAMQVAQRGTSTASITAADTFVVDRFATNIVTLGTWTMSQESDAPTGSGFRKSLKLLVTTADASPAAGDFAAIKTLFEGQNLQQFLKGTASAKQFSMTMWVKSGTTGTFIVELIDADNTRFCSQSYSVNAANTWEKKTLVFPADTTGAFDNDNGGSLAVNFYLAAGSTRNSGTLQTTWGTSSTTGRATGQVNLAAAAVAGTNYWQVTGVQLEAGSVATPFEFEDYGTTLAKCQRYYDEHKDEIFGGIASSTTNIQFASAAFSQVMRAAPTIVFYGNATANSVRSPGGATITLNSPSAGPSTRQVSYVNVSSGLTIGTFYQAGYTASAEL